MAPSVTSRAIYRIDNIAPPQMPNWFHYECFWKRSRCKAHTDIHGFSALRWDDQQRVKEKIGGLLPTPFF